MSSSLPKPALYSVPGGVLSLSGPALQELLRVVLVRGLPFKVTARGASMHPFIKDGDVVTVSPRAGHELRRGAVVAFCHPETQKLVLHRVLARLREGYLLRGDNVPEPDGLIPFEKVLGLVTKVERRGQGVRFGQGPEGLLLAWLSRRGLLRPVTYWLRQIIRPFLQEYQA